MPSFIPPPVLNSASSLQIVDNDQAVLTSSTDRALRLWSARGELIGKCHFAPVSGPSMSDRANSDTSRRRRHQVIEVEVAVLSPGGRADLRMSVHALEVVWDPKEEETGHRGVRQHRASRMAFPIVPKALCDANILRKSQIHLGGNKLCTR